MRATSKPTANAATITSSPNGAFVAHKRANPVAGFANTQHRLAVCTQPIASVVEFHPQTRKSERASTTDSTSIHVNTKSASATSAAKHAAPQAQLNAPHNTATYRDKRSSERSRQQHRRRCRQCADHYKKHTPQVSNEPTRTPTRPPHSRATCRIVAARRASVPNRQAAFAQA